MTTRPRIDLGLIFRRKSEFLIHLYGSYQFFFDQGTPGFRNFPGRFNCGTLGFLIAVIAEPQGPLTILVELISEPQGPLTTPSEAIKGPWGSVIQPNFEINRTQGAAILKLRDPMPPFHTSQDPPTDHGSGNGQKTPFRKRTLFGFRVLPRSQTTLTGNFPQLSHLQNPFSDV